MRLSVDLKARTKACASEVVRLYTGLPHSRKKIEVLGYQLLRDDRGISGEPIDWLVNERSKSLAVFTGDVPQIVKTGGSRSGSK